MWEFELQILFAVTGAVVGLSRQPILALKLHSQ